MRKPIYYHTQTGGSFDEAAAVLRGAPEGFLPSPATRVEGGFAVDLSADGMRGVPEIPAVVSFAEPPVAPAADLLIRPLTWRAATAGSLFPVLVGDLELEPLTDGCVRLALVGSYRPPMSVLGAAADQLLGRHVAEAVVRWFVMAVAERLMEPSTLAT